MAAIVRGKIQKSDLLGWDGKTLTGTRKDATGGTITGLVADYEVDVLEVFGDSTNYTISTISTALQRIGSSKVTIVFAPGTWVIDDNVTIPSTVTSRVPAGCTFAVSSGKTLTFNGPVFRESESWTSGSGTVVGGGLRAGPHIDKTTAETAASITPTDYTYEPDGVAQDEKRYGSVIDGSTDDTTAINNALSVAAQTDGGVFVLRPGTHIINPDNPLIIPPGIRMRGFGATLKLKAGDYSFTTSAFMRNRSNTTYDGGITFHENIIIEGISFDGNIANVTFSASGGVSAIALHQTKNVTLRHLNILNLPGTNGQGYGIISRYGNKMQVEHVVSNRTDRNTIVFLETTGEIKHCDLTHSYFREPILITADTSMSYQRSYALIDNCDLDNSATTSGSHVVRFSSHSSGALRDCRITGTTSLNGLYITATDEHDIDVFHNDFNTCLYGVLVESASKKTLHFAKNRYQSCTNGLRANAASTNGFITLEREHFDGISAQPIYINSFDNVKVHKSYVRGGNTNNFFGTFEKLEIDGLIVEDMTSSTQSVNIAGGSQVVPSTIRGIQFHNNTGNQVTIDENAFVTDCNGTVGGAGIPMTKVGGGYLWRDTTGDLRIAFSEPVKANVDSDGVVVGTQS